VTDSITRAAVIGSPIEHSLSPAMYNACFRHDHRDWIFDRMDVSIVGLEDAINLVRTEAYGALSVTMPLKEAIIPLLDEVSPHAAALHAVNSVVNRGGKLFGFNTDGQGCADAIEHRGHVDLNGAKVVLLGAGGTARSVALEMANRGAHVRVVNRTRERAEELVSTVLSLYPSATISMGELSDIASARVLINTTNVGMNSEESPVPGGLLHAGLVVLDAVYSPMTTTLLATSATAGCVTIDGLWMLVYQGCRQYQMWFNQPADPAIMRAAAETELATRQSSH
jgi:shikimate dehydrogenase